MNEEDKIRGYILEVYRDPEDQSWVAEVPDLPGCVAAGETAAEALEEAGDAIEAWIEAAEADGRPVPGPRPVDDEYSGRFLLRLPKSLHRRVALEARREGVSLNTYCVTSLAQSVGLAAANVTWSVTSPWPGTSAWTYYSLMTHQASLGYETSGRPVLALEPTARLGGNRLPAAIEVRH